MTEEQNKKKMRKIIEELIHHSLNNLEYLNHRKSEKTRDFVENLLRLVDIREAIGEEQYVQDVYNEAREYTARMKQIDELLVSDYSTLDKAQNSLEKHWGK